MTNLRTIPLSDLKPLRKNPRKATRRSQSLLEQSFEQNGAGRSVLLAANGDILAGNHATETYANIMDNDNVLVVDTDGTQLVAVRRQDIPDANDPRAQRLILADNRASDVADYDAEVLAAMLQEDQALVGEFYWPNELETILKSLSEAEPLNGTGYNNSTMEDDLLKFLNSDIRRLVLYVSHEEYPKLIASLDHLAKTMNKPDYTSIILELIYEKAASTTP